MKARCRASAVEFEITDKDLVFYEKLGVPVPTLCPAERERRRFAWRNERSLYHRKCDLSGRPIISIYRPESDLTVYAQDVWWSDAWNPLDYSQPYEAETPFEEQFHGLYQRVPRLAISNRGENCDYCSFSDGFKDSYMCISGVECEGCLYCFFGSYCHQCVDCSNLLRSQFCYECVDSQHLYECLFCQDCLHSRNLLFCTNCSSSENCFCCVGLHKKRYCAFNQQYTKNEYQAVVERYQPLTRKIIQTLWDRLATFQRNAVVKYQHGFSNENAIGDYITECRNVRYAIDVHCAQDVAFARNSVSGLLTSYDSSYSMDAELIYESLSTNYSHLQIGTAFCWSSNDIYYSDHCMNCSDLFACVGLRHSSYCILNKQYSKNDYHALKSKIIENMKIEGLWGEFLPMQLSPFCYNETIANDYYPLTEREATARGLKWLPTDEQRVTVGGNMPPGPESIGEVKNSILETAFSCSQSGRPFKIVKPELDFYRKMQLPLPDSCFGERILARVRRRNPRTFWHRTCDSCGDELESTYAPSRPETVLCDPCYGRAMFM